MAKTTLPRFHDMRKGGTLTDRAGNAYKIKEREKRPPASIEGAALRTMFWVERVADGVHRWVSEHAYNTSAAVYTPPPARVRPRPAVRVRPRLAPPSVPV